MDRQYRARKYRYADGIAYRQNLYHLHLLDDDHIHTKAILGGMIVCKNKVFAYVGHPTAVQEKIERITNSYHTKHFVWADNIEGALKAIKPYLEMQEA